MYLPILFNIYNSRPWNCLHNLSKGGFLTILCFYLCKYLLPNQETFMKKINNKYP